MVDNVRTSLAAAVVFCGLAAAAFAEEQLTITTYYPSPQGVYKKLRLYPAASSAVGACNSANEEGWMYYNNVTHGINVCRQSSPGVFSFQPIGFWDYNASIPGLSPANSSWNVEIGGPGISGDATLRVNRFISSDNFKSLSGSLGTAMRFSSAGAVVMVGDSNDDSPDEGTFIFAKHSEVSANRLMRIQENGNVGIGTDNPQAKLDVNGTVKADGALGAGHTVFVDYTEIKNYHSECYAAPWDNSHGDKVYALGACMSACREKCSGGVPGHAGLGYHGGVSVGWSSTGVRCDCY